MKTRVLALLFGTAMVFTLAACGSKEPKVETVEDMEYTITMQVWGDDGITPEEIQRDGAYTGETIDGIPNGSGTFKSQNQSGVQWVYEGDFQNGTFHGYGTCTWDDEGIIEEAGSYENGLFMPGKSDFISMVPKLILNDFSLPETSKDFIDAHENIFPCSDEQSREETLSMVDESIVYKQMAKNISEYTGTIIHLESLEATQVFENNAYGHTYTVIIAEDGNWNFYTIFYDGAVDLYEDDHFKLYGLPVSNSSYTNSLGGQTNTIAVVGSIIDVV